jgi:hypothetical protein
MAVRDEKTLVKKDPASQPSRNTRLFVLVLVVQVTLVVVVSVIAATWQNNLDREHNARSQTADCQFDYSAQLSKVLQTRSVIGERARLDNLSAAALNDLLNQHPYPKVPDCNR